MASGSASFSTSATNYGRLAVDSYYALSGQDVHNGPFTITGDLTVDGTSDLKGAVTCESTLQVPTLLLGSGPQAKLTSDAPGEVVIQSVGAAPGTYDGLLKVHDCHAYNAVIADGVVSAGGGLSLPMSGTRTAPISAVQLSLDPKPAFTGFAGFLSVVPDSAVASPTQGIYRGYFMAPNWDVSSTVVVANIATQNTNTVGSTVEYNYGSGPIIIPPGAPGNASTEPGVWQIYCVITSFDSTGFTAPATCLVQLTAIKAI